jgi:hypothetical protein
MPAPSQSFQTLDWSTALLFELTLPDGTRAVFATTGDRVVEPGERYWNSYDGELYRVTTTNETSVTVALEFGCGPTPCTLTFNRSWFTPHGQRLHHVTRSA